MALEIYKNGTYLYKNEDWHSSDSRWKAREVASILNRNAIHPSSIAEVGCGAGLILECLELEQKIGSEYFGFDVSPDLGEFWEKRKGGAQFKCADILNERKSYDAVLCLDVFEHVQDYMGFLRSLRKCGTSFVFHIPLELHVSAVMTDRQLVSREEVGHLHYFSEETAKAVLRDTGYNIIDFSYTSVSKERIPGRRKQLKTHVANMARLAVKFVFSERLAAKILGGYSLLVLAEKDATFSSER